MCKSTVLLLLALAAAGACSDSKAPAADAMGDDAPAYIAGSLVTGSDGTSTAYINVLASLDAQVLDYTTAYEFPGLADVWAWNGKVFVANGEAPTVKRYAVDANRNLVLEAEISFAAYGVASTAFWNAIWVSADKAYMADG